MDSSKKTKGPDASIFWHLRAMRHIVESHDDNLTRALRPHGLTAPLWRILNGLREKEDATIVDLAKHAVYDRSYVSRLVARLEAMGLIEARSNEADGRVKFLALTKQGAARHAKAAEVVRKVNEASVASLDEDERQQLQRLLDRVAESVGAKPY